MRGKARCVRQVWPIPAAGVGFETIVEKPVQLFLRAGFARAPDVKSRCPIRRFRQQTPGLQRLVIRPGGRCKHMFRREQGWIRPHSVPQSLPERREYLERATAFFFKSCGLNKQVACESLDLDPALAQRSFDPLLALAL